MRAISNSVVLCRCFSTSRQRRTLDFSLRIPKALHEETLLTEDLCCQLLDENPGILTLKKLHSRIIVSDHFYSNPSLGIKLMRAYSACGEPTIMRNLFNKIPHKNVVFFNVMIRSYVNNHLYQDALLVYTNMSSHGIEPDTYTFSCVLKACSGSDSLWVGLQIHAVVARVGLDSNLFVGNGLIAMYGKCDCLVYARRVLDGMLRRDVVSWNSLVAGYAQNGRFDEALEVCKEMELQRIKPDAGTMASLSRAITSTSSANISFVTELFNKMSNKGLVSWNVMIAVYVNNSMPAEAVEIFLQMEAEGIEPDAVTIASVLPACGDLSALVQGKKIHEYVIRKKLCPNLFLENALVDMYAKCGCLQAAREVFDKMRGPDAVTYTVLINGFCREGMIDEAHKLFKVMIRKGLKPDTITYTALMDGYCLKGQMNNATKVFDNMMERGHRPDIICYSVLINGFCKSRKIERALSLFEDMKSKGIIPNVTTYNSLISGFCIAGRTLEGHKLFNEMQAHCHCPDGLCTSTKGLEPNVITYTIMIDGFCKEGLLKEANEMFLQMEKKGIPPNEVTFNTLVKGFIQKNNAPMAMKYLHEMVERGLSPEDLTVSMVMNLFQSDGPNNEYLELFRKFFPK